jgi:predicted kinase
MLYAGMILSRPTLHFICGKLAAGKTTLARQIARDAPALLISEDEWLFHLSGGIKTFEEYLHYSARCRAILTPHVRNLLELGVSVVFDFAGNTPQHRSWVRSLFEATGANHVLHYVMASDDVCKAQLKLRNETRPEGLYWGTTTEEEFEKITGYFVPPSDSEGFTVVTNFPVR